MSQPRDILDFIFCQRDEIVFSENADKTSGPLYGEKRLMLEILKNAIDIASGIPIAGTSKGRQAGERQEAVLWFASDKTDWVFTFVNVCDWLGLDPGSIRKRVLSSKGVADSLKAPREPVRLYRRGRPRRAA